MKLDRSGDRGSRLAFCAAGGEVSKPELFAPLALAADLVIAADSGCDHLLRMGVTPRLLVGDLDSVSPEALSTARERGVRVVAYPAEKDLTDAEIVLQKAQEMGAATTVLIGAFGGRVDHTLANLLLLASPAFRRTDLRLLDELQEARLVRGEVRLLTRPGEVISLIPVGGTAHGVTTHGLHYPLRDAALETGPALGVSNVATGEEARVEVVSGSVIITRIFSGGFDARRYLVELGCTEG